MLIDIHNHTLYGVDDGPEDLRLSITMIKQAYEAGISTIVLTPHRRKGMFRYETNVVEEHFIRLCESVAEQNINIQLFLGCEYHVSSDIFDDCNGHRVHTMADGDFLLMEYKEESEFSYIKQYTRQALDFGYTPIIAHVERYETLVEDISRIEELIEIGAWIQVNADSVLELDIRPINKFVKKLLKNGFVDIVASDAHDTMFRKNNLAEAYKKVIKKYGQAEAERMFIDNPSKVIARKRRGL